MPQRPLSFETAKKTADAIRAAQGNQCLAADAMGVPRGTIATRTSAIRKRWPELLKGVGVGMGGNPGARKQRTLSGDVELHSARESEHAARGKLKDAIAEINRLRERVRNLEYAHNVSLKPANWTIDTRAPRRKSPHIPVLFFSDAQAGEVVRSSETDAPWDYDSAIFKARYRKMIATTIDLAMHHAGSRWTYPGIVYLRGGDNISGGLHEDLRELGEDCTAIQQCELVGSEEARGIQLLADAFGKVEVRTPGAAGNHDRTTKKPMSKLAWARSFDRIIHKLIAAEFKTDPRVTFHISQSPDIRFPVFEKRMLCTHGDRIGSSGGMGFVGPGATILRGWQKLMMEQGRLGYMVDMIWTGHFHYPMDLLIGTANGSFTGTTEFGKQFRMMPTPPLQYLQFFHPKYGAVDTRKLYLA